MMNPMPESPEDKKKVEELYETYHRLMYVLAYNILRQHEDAEDVVIESWEKIIRHLDKINKIDCQETKNFFVIVVERTAIDCYRKNKKRNAVQVLIDEYEESPYFATKDKALENLELLLANGSNTSAAAIGQNGNNLIDVQSVKYKINF